MFNVRSLEHYNLLDTASNLHDRSLARLLKSKAVSLAILTNIPVDVLYNFYFDNSATESKNPLYLVALAHPNASLDGISVALKVKVSQSNEAC